jgi:hypothetical protein
VICPWRQQGLFGGRAYIDEEKIIALVVVSSKTGKGLNSAMSLLRTVLETYIYGVKAVGVN